MSRGGVVATAGLMSVGVVHSPALLLCLYSAGVFVKQVLILWGDRA